MVHVHHQSTVERERERERESGAVTERASDPVRRSAPLLRQFGSGPMVNFWMAARS